MSTTFNSERPLQGIIRHRLVLILVCLPLYFGLCLFLPAGTWTWTRGWLFTLMFVVASVFIFVFLWRVNPDVVIARSHAHQGTKRWDKILLWLLFPTMWAIVPLAALDASRFHWFPVPWWVCLVGYAFLFVGMIITTWAEAVNKFFEVTVRIQADRGHSVIDTGPYAFVRHPGYFGAFLTAIGMALSLGSLWALIPVGVTVLLLIVRTQWEDQTLQNELAGYREYTQKVNYRLLPRYGNSPDGIIDDWKGWHHEHPRNFTDRHRCDCYCDLVLRRLALGESGLVIAVSICGRLGFGVTVL